MVLQHKGATIAIWAICGVLLIVVIGLTTFLVCRRKRKRELRKLQYQLFQTQNDQRTERATEWGVDGAAGGPLVAPLGHADGSDPPIRFPGFQRYTREEIEALPSPTESVSFVAPLVVHLRVRGDQASMESYDVQLTVERLRDSAPSDRSGYRLLCGESYYHMDYLLYTAPLEFREPGTYVIHAFTVYPSKHIVGAVHQFMYVVTRGGYGAGGPGTHGCISAESKQNNSINIEIARRLADRSHNALQPNATAYHRPSLGDGNEPAMRSLVVSDGAASVPSTLQRVGPPLPPVITPSGGEVMTSTSIVIAPNELSTTPDQLRYSVDGSYPNLLYTGPFTLSLLPPSLLPSQRRTVVIKAVAIRATDNNIINDPAVSASALLAMGSVSAITCVTVQVRPAGFSYFDAQVPAPSIRLRTIGATLYFDESQNPPNTQTVYELVYLNEARRKVRYSRQMAQIYNGEPIVIPESVATVHAWTVMSASASSIEAGERVRSVPSIYNCSRAVAERGKLSRRRIEQYNLKPEQLLPPPVMCVSCGDVELMFDDPPANGRIAYTLNNTEPALYDVYPPACAAPLHESNTRDSAARRRSHSEGSSIAGDRGGAHTFLYQPGKRIRVTQLETEQVYVTARVFLPIFEGSDGALYGNTGGQGGSCAGDGKLLGYRFGGVFHRGFYFNQRD
ncbi:hypothetical protein ABL78_3478 [Leptomonas seymouri]|uniref:Uncharacterized protein n=1 Tax=Leptomonas seymouri TaxID=5684 RepID=A0A0N0P6Q7_LEPSE|nr:hypothetical protein ABL78_3478 [Leptomonas seymouri]|eukprot:KPI87447.1 hypothetical protein ABL78_3478 [Leptomonas seymouri]